MKKLQIDTEPETFQGLLGLVASTGIIPAISLAVGLHRNASAALFLGFWVLMTGSLVSFWVLRLLAVLGLRAKTSGAGEKVALVAFQVAALLTFATVLFS